jgi:predicted ATPase/DNA-binding CsgD family transcriptional regulator
MSQSRPSLVAFPQRPSQHTEPPSVSHNLPSSPTPLIGREEEIKAVAETLCRPEVRLLTLIGPPGIGKTRLSIQGAADLLDDFPDGVCFVPLAPISDPDLVLNAITQALAIREASNRPLLESLKIYLQSKQMLLLLDNFEQVVSAAPLLADLLAGCPDVKIMVTSRELLQIYGEHDYPVPSLALPDPNRLPDLEALSQYEAIALFEQRARAVSPGFRVTERNAQAVAEICLRLDGLPLAIELAAARILVLPPEELLARLKSRLKLLTGGARNLPERQRTLQAAIDWSYNLLDPAEETLFRRLGVFVGGFTLEAAEQVCSLDLNLDTLDGVASLVGKSLLQRQDGLAGEPRFMMLETILEYARDRLEESRELDSIRECHLDYFMHLAENAEQGMLGSEHVLWMRRLDAEQNNLRAALEWSLEREGRIELGLRVVGALGRYWQTRGYLSEGRQWCAQLLSKTASAEPSVEHAKALHILGRMIFEQGNFAEAHPIYEKSLHMSRALGDNVGEITALGSLSAVALWHGEYDLAYSLITESLAIARKVGDRLLIRNALTLIGTILMLKEEYRAAQPPLEEALAINRELDWSSGIAATLSEQGTVAFHLGEHEKGKALLEESLGIAREVGIEWIIAKCLARLGVIALRQGDPEHAEALSVEGLARFRSSANKRWTRWYLMGLAEVARLRGMAERAAKLVGTSEGVISAPNAHYEPAMRAEVERITAAVRAEIDEETFARLWAEGQSMSLEETIEYALEPISEAIIEPEASSLLSTYPDGLTEREVEVLRLIATGKSNQEISEELVLSLRTVERHISNIYQKIGATGKVARAAAATYALKHGLAGS